MIDPGELSAMAAPGMGSAAAAEGAGLGGDALGALKKLAMKNPKLAVGLGLGGAALGIGSGIHSAMELNRKRNDWNDIKDAFHHYAAGPLQELTQKNPDTVHYINMLGKAAGLGLAGHAGVMAGKHLEKFMKKNDIHDTIQEDIQRRRQANAYAPRHVPQGDRGEHQRARTNRAPQRSEYRNRDEGSR